MIQNTAKRSRIIEIIAGILLIFSIIDGIKFAFSSFKGNFWEYVSLMCIFMILSPAIMMIFSLYNNSILRIVFCIGLVANSLLFVAELISYWSIGFPMSSLLDTSSTLIFILYILSAFIGSITAALTMFGKIKWQSRSTLMIYTCIMFAVLIIVAITTENVSFALVIIYLLPCFMQKNIEYKSVRGIVGEISVIILGVLPLLAPLIKKIYLIRSGADNKYLYYNSLYDQHSFMNISLKIILIAGIITLFLAPCIVFDKECAIEKYAASYEEQNPDEYRFRANFDDDDNE